MMEESKSIKAAPFKFRDYVISESYIKIEPKTKAASVDVDIKPHGVIYEGNKTFEIHLFIEIKSDDGLEVKVELVGFFEFSKVIEIGDLRNYFFVNAPAIMFPYLRSYISALTALSGCKTIILPPMNMVNIGQMLEKNTKTIKLG